MLQSMLHISGHDHCVDQCLGCMTEEKGVFLPLPSLNAPPRIRNLNYQRCMHAKERWLRGEAHAPEHAPYIWPCSLCGAMLGMHELKRASVFIDFHH